jgi:hypothetical protein
LLLNGPCTNDEQSIELAVTPDVEARNNQEISEFEKSSHVETINNVGMLMQSLMNSTRKPLQANVT